MTAVPSLGVRRELVLEMALAFAKFGSAARCASADETTNPTDRARLRAAGLVAGIGCELLQGISVLAEARSAYAAAALVRQLVEVEYLAWAVSDDPEDAIDWLQADRDRRLRWWQPGKIRQRADGRFPNADYRNHCESGGNPVAETAPKILDDRPLWVEIALYEACFHGTAAWHYLIRAFEDMGAPTVVDMAHERVDALYESWRRTDPLVKVEGLS